MKPSNRRTHGANSPGYVISRKMRVYVFINGMSKHKALIGAYFFALYNRSGRGLKAIGHIHYDFGW